MAVQKLFKFIVFSFVTFHMPWNAQAKFYTANPLNYLNFINGLIPGDTLHLEPGNYLNNLKLNNLNGTEQQAIVIEGTDFSSQFFAQACCNTVSISKCSYLILKDFSINGNGVEVDGIKAEGTIGNFAHHITIENLLILNHSVDQQVVGISTKCPAWNWIIRNNLIIGGGTGMYLGNSNGDQAFVNGIIENNYIANTKGYNLQIKHQFTGSRDSFDGLKVQGKTIIRHNVFSKEKDFSTGVNARPNVLVGGFPATGWGEHDYYEIYGNLFYQNPVEALFQGTGNIMLYNNLFINHSDPLGFRAIYITTQNQIKPKDIKIFHNTIWCANSQGGIRIFDYDPNYKQLCYANAVFCSFPITNIKDSLHNITGTYTDINSYIVSSTKNWNEDLYPQASKLKIPRTPDSLFNTLSNYDRDFNNDLFDWTYCGAYSGCCINTGWKLKPERKPPFRDTLSTAYEDHEFDLISVYPNPFKQSIHIHTPSKLKLLIFTIQGEFLKSIDLSEGTTRLELQELKARLYFFKFVSKRESLTLKVLKV